jgi:predicted O-methyltransferase YrrM
MRDSTRSIDELLRAVLALPGEWPFAGSLRPAVLARLVDHARARPPRHSAETGTGKSTLLLSHLCGDHTVFAIDDRGAGDSLASVQASPLLDRDAVRFVTGPSQTTLPAHRFAAPLDLVLIDGAHAFPFPHLDYYFFYPHLAQGALLIVDDIQLRAVNDLFRFLRADAMFTLLDVVRTTAFFRRSDAPTFDPLGDGWWLQGYHRARWPPPAGLSLLETVKALVPSSVKARLRRGGAPGG